MVLDCISNFVVIGQGMSERFEVSDHGVVSDGGVRDADSPDIFKG